jgi:iron complex outermembrane recepter protein
MKVWQALACCVGIALTLPALAMADSARFAIKAQPLPAALKAFAQQAHMQLLYEYGIVRDIRGNAVSGLLEKHAALVQLLRNTGLEAVFSADNAATIRPIRASPSATSTHGDATKSPSSQGFRVAQASPSQVARPSPVDQSASSGQDVALQEVVVTAQKRKERLQDVPMSLTALSGAQLSDSQSFRFEDYAGKVPGLTLNDYGALGSQLIIRGLTSGSQALNSSVATYVDETPYTAEGPLAGSYYSAPNLDTFDMQRIEVLRGPQGTLYGANALGGLLKYVTNPPDPAAFESTVETGLSGVEGGGTGFDAHGMVNLPLSTDAALRLVGYQNYYPGYIDDPSRGLTGINGTHFSGGRASMLYQVAPGLSVRFNVVYQERSYSDASTEDVEPGTLTPVHGNLVQENLIGQPGTARAQIYNLTLNWDAGFADLVSATSYISNQVNTLFDYSKEFGGLVSSIFDGNYGVGLGFATHVQGVTQELRLSSRDERPLQWLLGVFYTDEHSHNDESFFPVDAATRTSLFSDPLGLGAYYAATTYEEAAGFANLDYHLTQRFDVSLGGRYSENRQTLQQSSNGLFFGDQNFELPSSEGVFTYSADARWRPSDEQMLYARIAKGYVPGGPNDIVPTVQAPRTYSSSTTINYEVGLKSSFLDNRLTSELSAFYIDWRDIQVLAIVAGLGSFANGGTARSDGAEWTLAYAPLRGLTLDLNGAYTDARLTQDTPVTVGGTSGERLPLVPLLAMSAGASYARPLTGTYSAILGLDWRFTGDRFANFSANGPRQSMPGFNIVDLRAGIQTSRWTLTLYAKNVGNKIAIENLQPETLAGGSGPQSAVVFTPRTVGASVTVNLGM